MTHGMFAYEATLRVPLIVATIDPRVATRAAGVVIDSPVRHVDIAPTVMETIGATSDTDLSGSSLVDVIRNGRGDNRPTYFESMTYNLVRGWAPLRGVLAGRQKFVDQPIVELYDLSSDPREEQNVAPQEPERLRVMVNTLRSFNVAPPNLPAQESSEATAALRSLGYVSGTAPQRKVYTEADDLKNLVTIDRDLHRASELFQNGNVPDAIALFESVIDRRSDTADAYISLAHAYWETARPDVAVATLERALKNGAPDRDVRIRLALYLSESGIDAARAIALLETMPPTDVEALNGLGVAYGGARRYPDAIRAFNRVLALDPTNALALQNIASMVLRQALEGRDKGPKLREAETFARQAIDADPALAKAYTTLGVVLAETGRKPEAIDSWKTAVELDGREFDALYNLTVLLSEAGRIDDARAYARQFVDTAPPALYQPAIEQLRAFIGR
jgi:tetratricopeptide (TPR) repeat protein